MAFMIVSPGGAPLYELDLGAARRTPGVAPDDAARGAQALLHHALDAVDAVAWGTRETYLKAVDRAAEQLVSAHVLAGGARLLLLHDAGRPGEAAVGAFLADAAELLVRLQLNPFYTPGARVAHRDFDARVRALARRHLGAA